MIVAAYILVYFVIGIFICKEYVERTAITIKKNKKINMIKRVMSRLSIILFYPIYAVVLAILMLIELLTDDAPFE